MGPPGFPPLPGSESFAGFSESARSGSGVSATAGAGFLRRGHAGFFPANGIHRLAKFPSAGERDSPPGSPPAAGVSGERNFPPPGSREAGFSFWVAGSRFFTKFQSLPWPFKEVVDRWVPSQRRTTKPRRPAHGGREVGSSHRIFSAAGYRRFSVTRPKKSRFLVRGISEVGGIPAAAGKSR